jgi:cell division control protein 6
MGLFEVLEDKIFAKRIALSSEYIPDKLISRELQLKQVASLFAPALKGDKPHNAFIYGKTGVGKTAITKYVLLELDQEVSKLNARVRSTFVNCKQINTTTKILKRICNAVAPEVEIPATGLATSEYYDRLWKILNNFDGTIIVVFDEVDKIEDDGILYNLSRARENMDVTNGFISVLGISNDLNYKDNIDVRTLSSFGNKEFVFPPYDASQLREILEDRASIGFRQGVLESEVIPLCAALAAQEHGDARKALTLLEYAGEIAVEKGNSIITEAEVREAQERSEMDRIVEATKTLPMHEKIALLGIVSGGMKEMDTNEVYLNYHKLCEERDIKPLTKVRVSNFISELDMLGLITARKVSRGRYGLTRLITPNVSKEKVERLLYD